MAVSPLDPQSVRLTIASDIANRLSMLFVVHTQMGGWGDNTDMVCCLKQLISLVFFGGRYPSGCLCRARVPLFSVQPNSKWCFSHLMPTRILFVLVLQCYGSNFSVTSNNSATHSMMCLMKQKHALWVYLRSVTQSCKNNNETCKTVLQYKIISPVSPVSPELQCQFTSS